MYQLEKACAAMPTDQEKWVWVMDLAHYSFWHSTPLAVTRQTLDIFTRMFPERLHKAFICDAPYAFQVVWKLISPFIDPVTAAKISFINGRDTDVFKASIGEHISTDQLEPVRCERVLRLTCRTVVVTIISFLCLDFSALSALAALWRKNTIQSATRSAASRSTSCAIAFGRLRASSPPPRRRRRRRRRRRPLPLPPRLNKRRPLQRPRQSMRPLAVPRRNFISSSRQFNSQWHILYTIMFAFNLSAFSLRQFTCSAAVDKQPEVVGCPCPRHQSSKSSSSSSVPSAASTLASAAAHRVCERGEATDGGHAAPPAASLEPLPILMLPRSDDAGIPVLGGRGGGMPCAAPVPDVVKEDCRSTRRLALPPAADIAVAAEEPA